MPSYLKVGLAVQAGPQRPQQAGLRAAVLQLQVQGVAAGAAAAPAAVPSQRGLCRCPVHACAPSRQASASQPAAGCAHSQVRPIKGACASQPTHPHDALGIHCHARQAVLWTVAHEGRQRFCVPIDTMMKPCQPSVNNHDMSNL